MAKKSENEIIAQTESDSKKFLEGKKIKLVRYMTDKEQEDIMWHRKGIVIFFTDGSFIHPTSDNIGNNAGALFTSDEKLPVIPVI